MTEAEAIVYVALITAVVAPVVLSLVQSMKAGRGVKEAKVAAGAAVSVAADALESTAGLHERIGTPNGEGNVVQMLTKVLEGQATFLAQQAGQDRRLASLEHRGIDIERRVIALEQRSNA